MNRSRRALVAAALVLAGTLSPSSANMASAVPAGTVTKFAGVLGSGPATNLAMTPIGLAWHDGRLFIADSRSAHGRLPLLGTPYPGVIRALNTSTGVATVVAGDGYGGFSGDGGPATQAQLSDPTGIAFDGAGNLYVADRANDRVRRISPAGVISTFAGSGSFGFAGDGGPASSASFASPTRVAVASDGSLLVADVSNGRLRRVDPSGRISTSAGGGPPAPPRPGGPRLEDVRPWSVAAGRGGEVYVLDIHNEGLLKLSPDGTVAVVPSGLQWVPRAVTVEPAGTLLVAGQATLRRVDPVSGRIDVLAGTLDQTGFAGDGGPATRALLGAISDVVVDDAGMIYMADTSNHRVRRIALDGTISTVAGNGMAFRGGEGGPATAAQLSGARNLEASSTGVYFTEGDTHDGIERLTAVGIDGRLRTVTELPRGAAGMVVDPAGNVYLSIGSQVVKLSPAGQRTVVAGTGTPGFSGDGRLAALAQLDSPTSLALDGRGDLYIADNSGAGYPGRVRRVDRGGLISTFAGGGENASFHYAAGLARDANFGRINDIAIDAKGSLVVLGSGFPGAIIWRVTCGVAGKLPIPYVVPTAARIAVDAAGAVYVTRFAADHTVVVSRIDSDGRWTDVAGGGTEYRLEGRPARSVELRGGGEMAIDGAGNLLLSIQRGIVRVEGAGAPAAVPANPCETVPDRPVWAWGWNVVSQLGNGSAVDRDGPSFEDPAVTGAVALAGGTLHSLALKADGTVWAWGWNGFGQLGDGTTVLRSRAVQVPGLTGVTAIAAGAYGSLALKGDGTVWAWGWNGYGQLGDGTTADRFRPVQVVGLRNATAISANMVHSMAVTADGTAWTWGWNGFGLLGDGTNRERHVPGRVAGLAGVRSVAAGYFHSLAVTADGSVWGWGWNAQGQVGDGSMTDRWLPVRTGVTGATAVAAGNNHSVALAGGTAWVWGWNAFGQLGQFSAGHSSTPLRYSLPRVVAIAAGAYHTVALTSDGFVGGWGWNGFGQTVPRMGPDRPVAIGAGAYHSMAIYRLTP